MPTARLFRSGPTHWVGWASVVLGMGLVAALAQDAVQPSAHLVVKSVFVDDVSFGKDPFFPESKRRIPKQPTVAAPKPVFRPLEGLEVKGLSGTEPNRLAIINNRTFAVGEKLPVRIGDQRVVVECLEIREHSVVVKVGEQIRELEFSTKL